MKFYAAHNYFCGLEKHMQKYFCDIDIPTMPSFRPSFPVKQIDECLYFDQQVFKFRDDEISVTRNFVVRGI